MNRSTYEEEKEGRGISMGSHLKYSLFVLGFAMLISTKQLIFKMRPRYFPKFILCS